MTGVSDATSKRCEGDSWDITESVVSSAGRPWARLGRGIPADLADKAFSTTLLRAELGATE